jgi:hypothetical protein
MDTSDEWIPAFWTIVDIERPLRITFLIELQQPFSGC